MFKSQHQQAIMKLAFKQYAFGPEQNPPKSKGSPHFIVILYAYVES